MNNLIKRSLALLMALFLCLSLLPTTLVTVNAADYIYNWGTRGTLATSLSSNAEAFYTGNNTYDALSALAGGTSTDTVPDSALYSALQKLMKDAHSTETSYDGTRELYQYTDCQNGGGAISSFYSGKEIGPDWDGGSTWNREHTWPNSKGLGDNDENDIMMLRPTAVSENSSRGNAAYGESSGYYYPNTESGGAYDVRGDVARIFLYVYVRWGNVNGNGETDSDDNKYTTWGTQGVMESPEVMLKWMAEDPVDTWEMGRNDSVQSITGTRNVFVDYPELAFLLFGETVPADMTTPSGNADSSVEPDAPAVEPEEEETVAPQTVELTITATTGALASDSLSIAWEGSGVSFTNRKASSTSAIRTSDSDHFRVYAKSAVDFAAPGNITQIVVTCTSASYATVLATSAGSEATASGSVVTIIPTASAPTYTIETITAQTRLNKVAITYEVSGGETPEEPACQHTNTTTTTVDATCTEAGSTTVTCADCGETVSTTAIPATGHIYVDGVCSGCGLEQLNLEKATSLAVGDQVIIVCESKSMEMESFNGTSYAYGVAYIDAPVGAYTWTIVAGATEGTYAFQNADGAYMAWSSGNSLKTSTTLDANSYWNVEFVDGDAKIANSADATRLLQWNAGSPRFACYTSTQTAVQLYKIVTGSTEEPEEPDTPVVPDEPCQHTNTTTITVDATCTEAGSTTVTCDECNETVSTTVIPALGHNYVDGVCSVCGAEDPNYTPDEPVVPDEPAATIEATITFDDTAKRTAFDTTQQIWEENGITVTNLKGSSTSNVADYSKPVRFYKSSSLKVEYPSMTKIEFTCNTAAYATNLANSISGATASDKVVTVTFDAPQDAYEIASLSGGQVRMDSITVTASAGDTPDVPACEHTNTIADVNKVDATCTSKGYTGDTVCDDCGETVVAGEATEKLPHSYVDGACSVCGVKEPESAVATSQAYKFGMIQENVSATAVYYLTGAMDGYYMGTTTDADAAADVYVEQTEGGYYLYTYINSVKNYINMVVNDTYVNGAFETTASTVYTFNAEKGTLIATVNDTEYWFGTRNDGTYTTVGPVKVEYNGFYCKLYKFVEGNPNEPTCQHTNVNVGIDKVDATCTTKGHTGKTVCNDCGGTVDVGEETPLAEHTYVDGACSVCGAKEPEAALVTGQAYKFGMIQENVSATDVYYLTGAMDGYYMATTTDADAAIDVYVEQTEGGYYFYTMSGETKQYINMVVSDDGAHVNGAYEATASTVYTFDAEKGTLIAVVNDADYWFGTRNDKNYTTMGPCAVSYAGFYGMFYKFAEETVCEEHSFVDGVCSVCGHKLGDINGDGTVTYQDAVYILLANMFPEYSLDGVYADVNGDGIIDVDDAVYLLLHVLFGDLFYPLRTTVEG